MSDDGDDLGYQRITLRIPRDLHERLTASGKATSKSMNAEIIGRLQQTFRSLEERVGALEAAQDDEFGGEALFHRIGAVEEELKDIIRGLYERVKDLERFLQ